MSDASAERIERVARAAPADVVVLHTSDAQGAVGITCAGRLFAASLDSSGQHARSVLGTLQRVLKSAEVDLNALEGIVVTVGPGSFTGIRIGLATAQGLAAARDWPVWTTDSLQAEAEATKQAARSGPGGTEIFDPRVPLAVVQDARRGEVYAALYDGSEGRAPLQARVRPFCATPVEACTRMRAAMSAGPLAVVGSGTSLVRDALESAGPVVTHARPAAASMVSALATLAQNGGCSYLEAARLEPNYLRKSDAEIRRGLGT